MDTTWQRIQDILRQSVNPGLFKVWINPLRAEYQENALTLFAPNEFVASWVRERLRGEIIQASAQVLGREPKLHVMAETAAARDADAPGAKPAPAPSLAPPSGNGTGQQQIGLPLLSSNGGIGRTLPRHEWRYTFQDFVVGPCNELAFAAARSICHETMTSDVLFLSSPTGLGKTHLIQGLGKELGIQCNKRAPRVEYLTGEEFARQWVLALRGNELERFKNRFREEVDVLLMEDIHFFQGKEKMQDELVATLKTLQNRGAKVVLSSSFLPREIQAVDDQLVSRFCSGFLAVMERPDFLMRKRILEQKATVHNTVLPRDVSDLMAERINTDVRQLESCLQNLILKAKLLNRNITLDLAWQVVDAFAMAEPDMNLERIVDYVCETYALSEKDLRSKSRRRGVVVARNTAFFLARKYTELSLKEIGDRFNRRHSTVLKGISNVERELHLETPLGRQLARAMDIMQRRAGAVTARPMS